jgi:very-short-patch-repair endonuclease
MESSRKFGFDLLVEQVLGSVERQVAYRASYFEQGSGAGDTPIEKLFFLALQMQIEYGDDNVVDFTLEFMREVVLLDGPPDHHPIIIVPQAEIEGVGRVDFLIRAYATCEREMEPGLKPGWRNLIIECDGHDFHERTKEQAAKDRSRDRASTLTGYEVFRFTGAELWRDPLGCAKQVAAWVERGI